MESKQAIRTCQKNDDDDDENYDNDDDNNIGRHTAHTIVWWPNPK